MLYLDASVLVPCYAPEPWSEQAEALVLAAPQIAVSSLTIAETKNALVRKLKAGRLTRAEVEQAHAAIDQHLAANLYVLRAHGSPVPSGTNPSAGGAGLAAHGGEQRGPGTLFTQYEEVGGCAHFDTQSNRTLKSFSVYFKYGCNKSYGTVYADEDEGNGSFKAGFKAEW